MLTSTFLFITSIAGDELCGDVHTMIFDYLVMFPPLPMLHLTTPHSVFKNGRHLIVSDTPSKESTVLFFDKRGLTGILTVRLEGPADGFKWVLMLMKQMAWVS